MRFYCLLFGLLPNTLFAQLLWTSTFGEPNRREAYQQIDTLPNGDILLAGYADNPATQRSALLVRRMHPDGSEVWTRTYPRVVTEWVDALAVGADQVVIAARQTSARTQLIGLDHNGEISTDTSSFELRDVKLLDGPAGDTYVAGRKLGERSMHIRRLDAQFDSVWDRTFSGGGASPLGFGSSYLPLFLRAYTNGDLLVGAVVNGDNALYRLGADNTLHWGRPISDTVRDRITTAHLAADGTLTLAGSRLVDYFRRWPQLWRFDGNGKRTWEKRIWFVPPADTSRRDQVIRACVPLPDGGHRLLVEEDWSLYHNVRVDAAGDSLHLSEWLNPRYSDTELVYLHRPLLYPDGRLHWAAYRYRTQTKSVEAAWIRSDSSFAAPARQVFGAAVDTDPNELHRFTFGLADGSFALLSQAQDTYYGAPGRTLLHRTNARGRRTGVIELPALTDRRLFGALEVDGQIWVLAGETGEEESLYRFDVEGQLLAAPYPIPGFLSNSTYAPLVRLRNGHVALRTTAVHIFSPNGARLHTATQISPSRSLALLPDNRGGLVTGHVFGQQTDSTYALFLQLYHYTADATVDREREIFLHPAGEGQLSAIERVSDSTFLVVSELVDYNFDSTSITLDTVQTTVTLRLDDLSEAAAAYDFDTFLPFWFGGSHGNSTRFHLHYDEGLWVRSYDKWVQYDERAQPVAEYPPHEGYYWTPPVRSAAGTPVFSRSVWRQGQLDLQLTAYGREAPLPLADRIGLSAVSVYPNPADHQLNVRLDEPGFYGLATLVLYTADGKVLRRQTRALTGGPLTTAFAVTDLIPGLYYLHVQYGVSQHHLPVFIH